MEISGPQFLEAAVLGLKKGSGTSQDVLNARKANVTRRMNILKYGDPFIRESVTHFCIKLYTQTNFYAQCLIILRGYRLWLPLSRAALPFYLTMRYRIYSLYAATINVSPQHP